MKFLSQNRLEAEHLITLNFTSVLYLNLINKVQNYFCNCLRELRAFISYATTKLEKNLPLFFSKWGFDPTKKPWCGPEKSSKIFSESLTLIQSSSFLPHLHRIHYSRKKHCCLVVWITLYTLIRTKIRTIYTHLPTYFWSFKKNVCQNCKMSYDESI